MTTTTYDPQKKYSVNIIDKVYLEDGEDSFGVRIYQPEGTGPFPVLLDVHGGAWQGGSNTDGEYFDKKLAQSGVLVAAIDFRVAPKHPYPAQVIDVNYGVRWWKNECASFKGDASSFGLLGISSGGHTAMLAALSPDNMEYTERVFHTNTHTNASIDYYIGVSAVLDSHARYLYAKDAGMEHLIKGSVTYFGDEEMMKLGSPQFILESETYTDLPTALLIHGSADANVPNHIPQNFESTYKSKGGAIELAVFDGMYHSFVRYPEPESDEAIEIMKDFISKQV